MPAIGSSMEREVTGWRVFFLVVLRGEVVDIFMAGFGQSFVKSG